MEDLVTKNNLSLDFFLNQEQQKIYLNIEGSNIKRDTNGRLYVEINNVSNNNVFETVALANQAYITPAERLGKIVWVKDTDDIYKAYYWDNNGTGLLVEFSSNNATRNYKGEASTYAAALALTSDEGDIVLLNTDDDTHESGLYKRVGTDLVFQRDVVTIAEVIELLGNQQNGELVKITENGQTGYGLKYREENPNNYGDIGENAVDLSISDFLPSTTYGATGGYSFASNRSTASGTYSHAEGLSTASGVLAHSEGSSIASGRSSHAEGESTASGVLAHSEGYKTEAPSRAEHTQGHYNEIYTPQEVSTWNLTDRIHSIGIGTSNSDRKNALTIWKNGAFKWFSQALTNITNAVQGFHATDEEGRLNYHDGTTWKRYLVDGEGGDGTFTETDPIFSASPASQITQEHIDSLNQPIIKEW